MLSRITARIAFVIAIGLLLVCAILVYSTVLNLVESERLVTHTHQVQELLGETDSAIASAARARLSYVFSGADEALDQYQHDVARIPVIVSKLRQGTADNPPQQKHCDEVEILVTDSIVVLVGYIGNLIVELLVVRSVAYNVMKDSGHEPIVVLARM